jgi:phosphate-selective porin OprO/OprP
MRKREVSRLAFSTRWSIVAAMGVTTALGARPAHADPPVLRPLLLGETDLRFDAPDRTEGEDGFTATRLRLGAGLDIGTWFRAVAQAEWAREKPALLDAYAELRLAPGWALRAGASKTPLFVNGHDEPVFSLPVPERPLVVNAFWPGRDLGVEIHKLPERALPIEAWLRVGNGSGAVLGNDNSKFAVDFRLDVALGRARPNLRAIVATAPLGVRLGAGLHLDSVEDRPGVTGTTSGGFAFYRPPTVSGGRRVAEAHAVVFAGPVKVTGEVAVAREGRSRDTDGNPDTPRVALQGTTSSGAYVEAAWMIFGPRRKPGAWPVQTSWDRWDWGGVEIAGRFERLDLGMGAKDVVAGGATSGSVAVRWWATSYVALSAALYGYSYDTPPIEEPLRKDTWVALTRLTFRAPDSLAATLPALVP